MPEWLQQASRKCDEHQQPSDGTALHAADRWLLRFVFTVQLQQRYKPPVAYRSHLYALLYCSLAGLHTPAAAEQPLTAPRFTGSSSCASSSCHGGGEGKNQSLTWLRKDFHSRAHAILSTNRSARMAETLGLGDPRQSARCTVCHSPQQALPGARFVAGAVRDEGVSCETCHGPAEPWLLFHTRRDVTHEQRVAAGMRELVNFHGRANACIACHLNIDADLVRAGHPEMFFELDGQVAAQPPHWTDAGTWLGPRAWLVGQATALREMSWKLSHAQDPELFARWQALGWLLRQNRSGPRLPDGADFRAMQTAAERLARAAAAEDFTREKVLALLRTYGSLAAEFREKAAPAPELRRRGEVLVLAVDRLWAGLKTNAGAASPQLDSALEVLAQLSRAQAAFTPDRYAAALEQVEVALERGVGGW